MKYNAISYRRPSLRTFAPVAKRTLIHPVFIALIFATLATDSSTLAANKNTNAKPNVILIMTDDQGYGDLGCHGNPILKTPHLDKLHDQSIRLVDFHVDSFCTPTRAALMTGRYSSRTGAHRTSSGRTMLHTDEVTMADVFKTNGYATGIFGKWHLGDNAPHRPQDRGFTESLWHRCGGIGQGADHWGNDYFDDTYEHNGKLKKFKGYCTDVWFEGATKFIDQNHRDGTPFFCYIPTNAPHGPYIVDPKYAAPYRKDAKWGAGANFFGMIANIDENVGRLRQHIAKLGIEDDTIFIFMTDNGTAAGLSMKGLDGLPVQGFNAGMRGKKSSVYDGGHRVPCFIRWPNGGLGGKTKKQTRDITPLTAHIDLLPTLIDLCKLTPNQNVTLDGQSLAPLLRGTIKEPAPERTLLLQFQGGAHFNYAPKPLTDSVVMTSRWRLMDGVRLYDIKADPTQSNDIAAQHPKVVAQLRKQYDAWWQDISPRLKTPVHIAIGHPDDNPTTLTSQDWYMPKGNPPWHPNMINRLPKVTGPWLINVNRAGKYKITLRQKPAIANFAITATKAQLRITGQGGKGNAINETQPVKTDATGVTFEVELAAGPARLETLLSYKEGKTGGACFADVVFVENSD